MKYAPQTEGGSVSAASKPVLSYNLAEAAKAVGMSERTIADAIRRGDLPSYRPATRVLVLADDLLAWIKASAA